MDKTEILIFEYLFLFPKIINYCDVSGNFTCLAIVFNLRRRLGYHLFHTYIPSALIVVMSWISFWIKPEAIPARVTLGVTSLLTLGKIDVISINKMLGIDLLT